MLFKCVTVESVFWAASLLGGVLSLLAPGIEIGGIVTIVLAACLGALSPGILRSVRLSDMHCGR